MFKYLLLLGLVVIPLRSQSNLGITINNTRVNGGINGDYLKVNPNGSLGQGTPSSGGPTLNCSTVGNFMTYGSSTQLNCVLGVPFVLVSTSGPVSDPGGVAGFQFNNAAGALTFNAPAGVAGYQRCYRNATGKSGAITIQLPASNTVDLAGTNGSTAGTLVSTGVVGDAVCIVSDVANHWYAYVSSGSWSTT